MSANAANIHKEAHNCDKKKRYATAKQARLALMSCWKVGGQQRRERSFYPCWCCDGFHLSSELPNKDTGNLV